jgi:hypothetical protein
MGEATRARPGPGRMSRGPAAVGLERRWRAPPSDFEKAALTPLHAENLLLPPRPRSIARRIPDKVKALVEQCWAADYEARPEFVQVGRPGGGVGVGRPRLGGVPRAVPPLLRAHTGFPESHGAWGAGVWPRLPTGWAPLPLQPPAPPPLRPPPGHLGAGGRAEGAARGQAQRQRRHRLLLQRDVTRRGGPVASLPPLLPPPPHTPSLSLSLDPRCPAAGPPRALPHGSGAKARRVVLPAEAPGLLHSPRARGPALTLMTRALARLHLTRPHPLRRPACGAPPPHYRN